MNILIDTNVALDVLLGREPFVEQSSKVILLSEKAVINGYISASTATDIFYIVRKHTRDANKAYDSMKSLLRVVNVAVIDGKTIDEALELRWKDFEDCLQFVAARELKADYIVTRDMDGFAESEIPAIAPGDFLEALKTGEK
jgi:predicted nucleic acid-binding protein